jgi:hypothetical protein
MSNRLDSTQHFAVAVASVMLIIMFAGIARTAPGIGFRQGNTQSADEGNAKSGCLCGAHQFDCICGIGVWIDLGSAKQVPVRDGQIYAVVSSYVLSGVTLQVVLQNVLAMKLKSNNFAQREAVSLDPASAHRLGYESVTIQPGMYTLRGGKSLVLNVKLGKRTVDTSKK